LYVEPLDMIAELREDNKETVARLREAHGVCDEYGDIATANLLRSGLTRPSVAPGFSSRWPARARLAIDRRIESTRQR
jgi:hypothetical protein